MSRNRKLTKEDVTEIKLLLESDMSVKELSQGYGFFDGSALRKALASYNKKIVHTLRPIY